MEEITASEENGVKEMIQATPGKSEKTKDDGRSPNTKQERPKEERGPRKRTDLGIFFLGIFFLYSMLEMRKRIYKMTCFLLYSDLKFK